MITEPLQEIRALNGCALLTVGLIVAAIFAVEVWYGRRVLRNTWSRTLLSRIAGFEWLFLVLIALACFAAAAEAIILRGEVVRVSFELGVIGWMWAASLLILRLVRQQRRHTTSEQQPITASQQQLS